ncbi:MAG: CAP domain-containing protein [Thermoleophilia bacterium]|nr:CAP domain-containing protein [Thermoleophilia bacterium]
MIRSPFTLARTVLLCTTIMLGLMFSLVSISAKASVTVRTSASSYSQVHVAAMDDDETALLKLINKYRVAHHRSALRADKRLDTAATWMARDLGARDQVVLSHTDSRHRFVDKRLKAFKYPVSRCTAKEDLAAGQPAPADVIAQWKGSKTHRKNMLARGMHAVGLARVQVPGSRYDWYWVIEIGSCVSKKL